MNRLIYFFIYEILAISNQLMMTSAEKPKQKVCHLKDNFPRGLKLTRSFETTSPCSVVPDNLQTEFQEALRNNTLKMHFIDSKVSRLFQVNPLDGSLISKQIIDREEMCKMATVCCQQKQICVFHLVVVMKYFTQVVKLLKVQVELLDLNDHAPKFAEREKELEIVENSANGTRFFLPSASDWDSVAYSIDSYHLEPSDGGPFSLISTGNAGDQQSIYLQVIKPLDREQLSEYKYRLIATDKGQPPLTGVLLLRIRILDSNDNFPQFTQKQYNVNISEMAEPGTKVIQLQAYDKDQGVNAEVMYLVGQSASQNVGNDDFRLDVQSGWLIVNRRLDYESRQRYEIPVVARDRAGHPNQDEAIVNICVNDWNDHAPRISVQYLLANENPSISESISPIHELTIGYVDVIDPDTGKGGRVQCRVNENSKFYLQFAFDGGENGVGQIEASVNKSANVPVDSNSNSKGVAYQLKLNGTLDREINATERFKICCQDEGEVPKSTCSLQTIQIEDVNDNDPIFDQSNYTTFLRENNLIGIIVLTVHASDRDARPNNQITYSLFQDFGKHFQINQHSGRIYAEQSFDRELTNQYQFKVCATDKGGRSSTALITVLIQDENDEAPYFTNFNGHDSLKQDYYEFQITENVPADTKVGYVLAEDKDLDENSNLIYTLSGKKDVNEFVGAFRIDAKTGNIFTRKSLDREQLSSYNLFVTVTDSPRLSAQKKSAVAPVRIQVLDVNDESPKIQFPTQQNNSFRLSYQEMMGQVVLAVQAMDKDAGQNGLLQYEIVSGDLQGLFRIDTQTGEITVTRNMEESDQRNYHLRIRVRDCGDKPLESYVSLQIIVDSSEPKIPLNKPKKAENRLGTSAILVAIVGLICVIVLVMLCMTLYICNRRGFSLSRCCAEEHRWKASNGVVLKLGETKTCLSSGISHTAKQSVEEAECAMAFLPRLLNRELTEKDFNDQMYTTYPAVMDDGYRTLDPAMMASEQLRLTDRKVAGFYSLKPPSNSNTSRRQATDEKKASAYCELNREHAYTVEHGHSAQQSARLLSTSESRLNSTFGRTSSFSRCHSPQTQHSTQPAFLENSTSLAHLQDRTKNNTFYDELSTCSQEHTLHGKYPSKVYSIPKSSFV